MYELTEEFINYLRVKNYSKATIANYKIYVTKFISYCDMESISRITEVTGLVIEEYVSYCLSEVTSARKGETLNPGTVQNRIKPLKLFFKYLVTTDRLLVSPAADTVMPKTTAKIPRNILSIDEIFSVLSLPDMSSSRGFRNRIILEILYTTGVRSKELVGINVEDIDFAQKTILVHGKGNKDRLVPLHKEVEPLLTTYIKNVRGSYLRGYRSNALFLSQKLNTRLATQSILNIVRYYAKAAGITKEICTHSFRHTCATHLLQSGADIRYVQKLLGHNCINTTTIYTRVDVSDLRKKVDALHPRSQMDNE